ncbi:hypothetical protein [Microbulbifer sp. PSTR4-B]|uniref:hypothetical protein n=1 Tax=Microbulbifer sp. PSTR4-B TaxID=3243396 RepID=UPI004039BAE2
MIIQQVAKDKINVIKHNGEEFGGLKAVVGSSGIILEYSGFLVEPNDLIQREMSNGGIENFQVIDPGYNEGHPPIKPFYNMKVKKLGLPEAEKVRQSITYNFSGPNARVNNDSVDNSTNVVNVNSDVAEHISALRSEVNRLVTDEQEKREALELVDAIEGQFSTDSPSKSVVKTLISALPSLGNIASIGSLLLSAVSTLPV